MSERTDEYLRVLDEYGQATTDAKEDELLARMDVLWLALTPKEREEIG